MPYTSEQIRQFYDRIQLPRSYRHDPGNESRAVARGSRDAALEYLGALQRYTLCHVPFENLELHYSRIKAIDLDPDALFQKIVLQGTGRGGYCMEINTLFAVVLRSLGFELITTGARVNSSQGKTSDRPYYTGFTHMVIIVSIQNKRYMVDAGFGGGASTRPVLLEDGKTQLNMEPSQSVRTSYGPIDHGASDMWKFERRNRDDQDWSVLFCFPDDLEFSPSDFKIMNFYTSQARDVFFTFQIVGVKYIMDEEGEEIVGEYTLVGNRLRRRIAGRIEMEVELRSEPDRIEALEKYMDIKLDAHQRSGILGTSTMIT